MNVKNKTGPKEATKFSRLTVTKLETAFALGCSVSEACIYADISRETFYRHCKEKPELYDRFMLLKHTPILKARQTIVNALSNPDHAKWYLKNKCNDEFTEKPKEPDPARFLFPTKMNTHDGFRTSD